MAKAQSNTRYAVSMKKLLEYKAIQTQVLLDLNTEFIGVLKKEMKYTTQNLLTTGFPNLEMQRVWTNQKVANLALTRCVHRNLIWADVKSAELVRLHDEENHRPKQLDALLKDKLVISRLGNV
jgi:hypothetical protein